MAYKIVHWELMGADGAALKTFYQDLFDWSMEGVPGFGDYYMTNEAETGLAGAVGKGSEDMPNYQVMYVEVPDIDAHMAKVEAAGGTTVVPAYGHPGHGHLWYVHRPRWQPGRPGRTRLIQIIVGVFEPPDLRGFVASRCSRVAHRASTPLPHTSFRQQGLGRYRTSRCKRWWLFCGRNAGT